MKFEFFKDTLGTIWYRDCVEVEANSYEEAKQKMIDAVKYDDELEEVETINENEFVSTSMDKLLFECEN